MKTSLTILTFVIPCTMLFGQITSRDISEKKAAPKIKKYDSLSAFSQYEDLRMYIGQELFFLPISKKRPKDEYGFKLYTAAIASGDKKAKVYSPVAAMYSTFDTDPKQISGKYFAVADFLDKDDRFKYKNFDEIGLYFKLFSKERRDTAYYQIAKFRAHLSPNLDIPFIIAGHFDRLKKLHVGKKFQSQKEIQSVPEINSGQSINCAPGSWWECADLTLVDLEDKKYSHPVLIFRNDKAEEILVEAPGYTAAIKAKRADFLTQEEMEEKRKQEELQAQKLAEQKIKEEEEKKAREEQERKADQEFRQDCIKKYGARFGNLIADRKVAVGMTKEMCSLAWGSPERINKTTIASGTREQWVYDIGRYLYFDNDKLTTIQN